MGVQNGNDGDAGETGESDATPIALPPANVPVLSAWGAAALALVLAAFGWRSLRRRG